MLDIYAADRECGRALAAAGLNSALITPRNRVGCAIGKHTHLHGCPGDYYGFPHFYSNFLRFRASHGSNLRTMLKRKNRKKWQEQRSKNGSSGNQRSQEGREHHRPGMHLKTFITHSFTTSFCNRKIKSLLEYPQKLFLTNNCSRSN